MVVVVAAAAAVVVAAAAAAVVVAAAAAAVVAVVADADVAIVDVVPVVCGIVVIVVLGVLCCSSCACSCCRSLCCCWRCRCLLAEKHALKNGGKETTNTEHQRHTVVSLKEGTPPKGNTIPYFEGHPNDFSRLLQVQGDSESFQALLTPCSFVLSVLKAIADKKKVVCQKDLDIAAKRAASTVRTVEIATAPFLFLRAECISQRAAPH